MTAVVLIVLALFLVSPAQAKLVTRAIEYTAGDTPCTGYLAYDDTRHHKRPGVLVVHEWWGLNDFAKQKAEELAQLGYVGLAADIYGGGMVTGNPQEAGKLAAAVKGTPLLRQRARAALRVLADQPLVALPNLAAIGFCFGGTTVLELAYSGADLAGVVSFHGGLTTPQPDDPKPLKAKILVLHGADDPLVKAEEIAAFQQAMRDWQADWQMIFYGGAVHSFTNPGADKLGIAGVAYHPQTAGRSWKQMQVFFADLFGRKTPRPLKRLID